MGMLLIIIRLLPVFIVTGRSSLSSWGMRPERCSGQGGSDSVLEKEPWPEPGWYCGLGPSITRPVGLALFCLFPWVFLGQVIKSWAFLRDWSREGVAAEACTIHTLCRWDSVGHRPEAAHGQWGRRGCGGRLAEKPAAAGSIGTASPAGSNVITVAIRSHANPLGLISPPSQCKRLHKQQKAKPNQTQPFPGSQLDPTSLFSDSCSADQTADDSTVLHLTVSGLFSYCPSRELHVPYLRSKGARFRSTGRCARGLASYTRTPHSPAPYPSWK